MPSQAGPSRNPHPLQTDYLLRLLGWRSLLALLVTLAYLLWGGFVVMSAGELQAEADQRTAWLHELQYAEHKLLSHHPEEPEIRDALSQITRVRQGLEGLPDHRAEQLGAAVRGLRESLEVRLERDQARTALLQAIHDETQLLFQDLSGLSSRKNFRWRQLWYLALSAVAVTMLAIFAMLLARHRRLDAERLGERLERAIHEAEGARQEAQRANQAKSSFLATVSHELRTPMTAILGTVDLLGRTTLSSRQADYLTAIRSSGESLQRLIDDVLDLSRIEAGRLELQREPFELDELLDALALMFGERAEARGLDLSILCLGAPTALTGDSHRLRQVLVNLLGNALKFTEEGSVELRVSTEPREPDRLRFEVQDTGPGLADDQRERIFRPFTQADSSLTRTHGGAGLGLAICRRLVEGMGGELKVQSELGQGSTFSFTAELTSERPTDTIEAPGPLVLLGTGAPIAAVARQLAAWSIDHHRGAELAEVAPCMDEAPFGAAGTLLLSADQPRPEHPALLTWRVLRLVGFSEAGGPAEPGVTRSLVAPVRPSLVRALLDPERDLQRAEEAEQGTSVAGYRVLIVDDNEMNRLVLAEMLTTLGGRVTLASSGEQALERAREAPFDLIFMDSEMPGMDGFETTRRLREAQGDAPRTPIVGLSGHVTPEHRRRGLEAGLDDYLAKPIQLGTLERAVRRWCEERGDAE
jgi:two-component system sensor histidine kinase BarA